MYILAIETTGKYASAAIIDKDGNCFNRTSYQEMSHLSEIIVLLQECLEHVQISKDDITAVAASVGPGSFTGIRIGVSVARAISQMLGIPCIAVSSLKGMANRAATKSSKTYIASMINARRGQLYGAVYDRDLNEIMPETQYMIDEFLSEIKKKDISFNNLIFIGDGIDAYKKDIEEFINSNEAVSVSPAFADEDWCYQSGEDIALLALAKFEEGKSMNYNELLPNYMRKSEAEMRLAAGTLSSKIGVRR